MIFIRNHFLVVSFNYLLALFLSPIIDIRRNLTAEYFGINFEVNLAKIYTSRNNPLYGKI